MAFTATQEGEKLFHSVVLVKLNGVTWRTFFGYRGNRLLRPEMHLESIKSCTVTHCNAPLQTIVGTFTKRKGAYNVQVSDTKGSYTIRLGAKRIDRARVLCVENPNFREIIRS